MKNTSIFTIFPWCLRTDRSAPTVQNIFLHLCNMVCAQFETGQTSYIATLVSLILQFQLNQVDPALAT